MKNKKAKNMMADVLTHKTGFKHMWVNAGAFKGKMKPRMMVDIYGNFAFHNWHSPIVSLTGYQLKGIN